MPWVTFSDGREYFLTPEEYSQYQGYIEQEQGQYPETPVDGGGADPAKAFAQTLTAAALQEGLKQGVKSGYTALTTPSSTVAPNATSTVASSTPAASAAVSSSPTVPGWGAYQGIVSQVAPEAGANYGAQTASTWGSTASQALPWLGLAGQAYQYGTQGYDAYKKLTNDSASDDASGSIKAGLLATGPFLGWAAPFVDMVGLKSGKGEDQLMRDGYRRNMREFGVLDDDYRFQAPNGQYFDFGSEKLRAYSADPDKRGEVIEGMVPNDRAYNIDWDNVDHNLVGAVNPLAFISTGGNQERYGNLAGQMYNAAMLSGDPYAFVQSMYDKYAEQGIGRDGFTHTFNQWAQEGKLDEGTRDAFIAGVDGNTKNQIGQPSVQQQPMFGPAPQQPQSSMPAASVPSAQPQVNIPQPIQAPRNEGRPAPMQEGSSTPPRLTNNAPKLPGSFGRYFAMKGAR